ncbi:unnamed protein product [Paramecium sonneborni]|uniref:Uncharacterized protein n=1 Tax=Paramecium sonneborni TaxID=65129 RepID=A0A8S1RNV1_9CILI|nr:unnamed protein product [Paramecium sonneborni]
MIRQSLGQIKHYKLIQIIVIHYLLKRKFQGDQINFLEQSFLQIKLYQQIQSIVIHHIQKVFHYFHQINLMKL